jgi:hypothetical protein
MDEDMDERRCYRAYLLERRKYQSADAASAFAGAASGSLESMIRKNGNRFSVATNAGGVCAAAILNKEMRL